MTEMNISLKYNEEEGGFDAKIQGSFSTLTKKEVVVFLGALEYLKKEVLSIEESIDG
jgi:hypothetical protein